MRCDQKSEVIKRDAESALEQAQLKRSAAQADSAAARETFNNWLSTRRATQPQLDAAHGAKGGAFFVLRAARQATHGNTPRTVDRRGAQPN